MEEAEPGAEGPSSAESDDGRMSREDFDEMERGVLGSSAAQKSERALEAAKQLKLGKEVIEGLRAERNSYLQEKAEAISKAFDLADGAIAQALREGRTEGIKAPDVPHSNDPSVYDIADVLVFRLYDVPEEEKGQKRSIDIIEAGGQLKIPGLKAYAVKGEAKGLQAGQRMESLGVVWDPTARS